MTWQKWKGIMKAYPWEEKRLAKWEPPYICQPKYDGDRCWGEKVSNEGGWLLIQSGGNPVFSVPHINESLGRSPLPMNLKLDGELYNHNICLEGGHELVHSIASRTTNLHPRYKELELHLFDIKDSTQPQIKRLMRLEKIKDLNIPHVKVSPFYICESLDGIKRVYDDLIKKGYEGIIVRHLHADYREKRSIMLMKFKPKRKDEYRIVGVNEEYTMDGQPKGRLGSLIMSSQTGDTFCVSAGLNDEQREHLWKVRGLLPGTMATVHFQHLTMYKTPKGTFDIEIPEFGV